ncbi:hypothetical protein [Helicobacter sp. 11S02596-1]|uniref:hypothetical protein n=1 Tax=Helicobacter sp. 11S02596-1 TaxID=1476194 RepID=UPI000BA65FFB|nr:hypothetical protein [Helicobacter sp. 11S02596-1]PAF41124.1 hypothetical protein BJI48_09015 [Helicobacter sp. 11S02596-1]
MNLKIAFIVGIIAIGGYLGISNALLKKQLENKTLELQIAKANTATLQTALEEQNHAIEKITLDTQVFKESLPAKKQAIQKEIQNKLPKVNPTSCEEALRAIIKLQGP